MIFLAVFGSELLESVTTSLDGSLPGVERADSTETDAEDPLEVLRTRYAAGELTDEEFERKLETLVATETREEVSAYVDGPAEDVSERELDRA